jgi:hypothetical protein
VEDFFLEKTQKVDISYLSVMVVVLEEVWGLIQKGLAQVGILAMIMDRLMLVLGGDAGAGVALGPAQIAISGNAGVNVEKPGGPSLYYGGGFNYGLSSGWKLRAGAAAGGEITFY